MKELIPKSKDDFSPFEKLESKSIEEFYPIVMDLLKWLQDGNWPIFNAIVKIFEDKIDKIEKEILQILKSSDEVWKYWIISDLLFQSSTPLPKSIYEELVRIKNHPNPREHNEEVDLVAEELIDYHLKKWRNVPPLVHMEIG